MYHPSPNVVFTELDEAESVLLHLKTRQYFSLNETGTLIWKNLQEGKSVGEIAAAVEQAYEVDGPLALHQVEAFLESLSEDRLVEKA